MPRPARILLALAGLAALIALVSVDTGGTRPAPRPFLFLRPATTTPGSRSTQSLPASTTTTTTTTVPVERSASPQPTLTVTYMVQPGDTVAAIAAANGADWRALCAANRLADCGLIYPGETLILTGWTPAATKGVANPFTKMASRPPKMASRPHPAATSAGIGCPAALAYLAAHQAPGFADTCINGRPAICQFTAGAVGCTIAYGQVNGPVTGQIYVDGNCNQVAAANEAANSMRLSGRSNGPPDPYGYARCPS